MKILLAVFVASTLWLQIVHGDQQISALPLRTRQIIEQPNVPLASQLRDGDEIVLVERAGYETRFVDTTVRSVSEDLDFRARASDVIVVADCVTSKGILINNDSWVRSKVTFRPVRVVKDSKQVVSAAGADLTVFHDGGDIRLKGVFVRVGYFYVYKPNGRYLLFLRSFSQDNNAHLGLQMGIAANNKLSPMELSTGQTFPAISSLYGLDLEVVIGELSRRLLPKTPK